MLSNTTAIAPTDIWKLSDPNILPQLGSQFSLGAYKNLKNNTIETSVEVYYKNIQNYLDYKSGAVLILNHHIETDVLNTKGKAYGVEMMIRKATTARSWNSRTPMMSRPCGVPSSIRSASIFDTMAVELIASAPPSTSPACQP